MADIGRWLNWITNQDGSLDTFFFSSSLFWFFSFISRRFIYASCASSLFVCILNLCVADPFFVRQYNGMSLRAHIERQSQRNRAREIEIDAENKRHSKKHTIEYCELCRWQWLAVYCKIIKWIGSLWCFFVVDFFFFCFSCSENESKFLLKIPKQHSRAHTHTQRNWIKFWWTIQIQSTLPLAYFHLYSMPYRGIACIFPYFYFALTTLTRINLYMRLNCIGRSVTLSPNISHIHNLLVLSIHKI